MRRFVFVLLCCVRIFVWSNAACKLKGICFGTESSVLEMREHAWNSNVYLVCGVVELRARIFTTSSWKWHLSPRANAAAIPSTVFVIFFGMPRKSSPKGSEAFPWPTWTLNVALTYVWETSVQNVRDRRSKWTGRVLRPDHSGIMFLFCGFGNISKIRKQDYVNHPSKKWQQYLVWKGMDGQTVW